MLSASLLASSLTIILGAASAGAQVTTPPPANPPPSPLVPDNATDPDAVDPAPAPAEATEAPEPAPVITAPPPPPPEPAPSYPSVGKTGEVKLSDTVWFRIGVQAQTWAHFQQSPIQANGDDGGYSRDLFFRRARVLVGAQLAKIGETGNVSALLNLESSNLGKAAAGPPDAMMNPTATKTDGTVRILDGFGEVKFANEFAIDAGMMLVPFTRNILQSTVTYLGLDFGNTTGVVVGGGSTVGNSGRDLGFQVKGQLAAGKLEYRAGVFQGVRKPADGNGTVLSENPFRVAGYLQYNALDPEQGYVFNGTYFGKKRVLGVAVGADYQPADEGNAYRAFSGSVFAALPIAGAAPTGGDELAALVQFIRYDGKDAIPSIAAQNDILAELAFYSKALKASVFAKAEAQLFVSDTMQAAGVAGNKIWYGGGLKYFVAEQKANFTLAYQRLQFPEADTAMVNPANQITLQMQLFHF